MERFMRRLYSCGRSRYPPQVVSEDVFSFLMFHGICVLLPVFTPEVLEVLLHWIGVVWRDKLAQRIQQKRRSICTVVHILGGVPAPFVVLH